jgi:arginine decarboxylase
MPDRKPRPLPRATMVYYGAAVGTHQEDKNAFDRASAQIGVARLNLITLSSILPPGVREIGREEFEQLTQDACEVHAIHGICKSNVRGQLVTAGMGRVRPQDPKVTGYVTELFEHPGIPPEALRYRVETMALQIFADRNGLEGKFRAADVWDPDKTDYVIAGRDVVIDSLIAAGQVNMDGDYTAALVLAALLP